MWYERRDVQNKRKRFIREDDLRDELAVYYGQYHPHQKWVLERTDVAIDSLEIGHILYADHAEYRCVESN